MLSCNMGEVLFAATYSTKSSTSPGYKFEESASWTGGSLPGTYNGTTFSVNDGTTININGYVALKGNLNWASDDFFSSSTLNVKKNSILVINGNFDISDRVDVILEENATLYVKGNFITHNNSTVLQYVDFQLDKNSNVVVEKNVTSASGASVCIYRDNGNADFYIFGSYTGNIYKKNHSYDVLAKGDGSSYLEDEQDYTNNEAALIRTVSTITESLLAEDCVLHVPNNTTMYINSEITVCGIDMQGTNSSLIINTNGILNIDDNVTISQGIISNYGQISSTHDLTILPRHVNGNAACQFYNNGSVSVKNFKLGARGDNKEANTNDFSFTCGSSIIASNSIDFVVLGWTGQLNLLGNYSAESMTIDYESGGDIVNFGDDCGDSEVSLTSLTLIAGVSVVNVHEITGLENLILNTNSSVKMDVDGVLTIGNITTNHGQGFGISGNESSIIRLCYNPTSGQDYGLNGATNSTKGTVYYIWSSSAANTWYGSGETNPYHKPSDENDVTCNGCRQVANNVSFDDCMDGVSNFLPIELVSFSYDKSNGKFIWTTASETDNDYFVVEYSKNGEDWTECTEHVVSMSNTGYAYNTEPIIPINESLFSYFRLKQVDLNGDYSYSNVIIVSFFVENPCSEDNENSKIQIREFGNKWFRLINGELIYCENDNE